MAKRNQRLANLAVGGYPNQAFDLYRSFTVEIYLKLFFVLSIVVMVWLAIIALMWDTFYGWDARLNDWTKQLNVWLTKVCIPFFMYAIIYVVFFMKS